MFTVSLQYILKAITLFSCKARAYPCGTTFNALLSHIYY
jgi:hypothetical protein